MAKEIERKFLVSNESWRPGAVAVAYSQGYLYSDEKKVIRVRIAGEKAFLTIKGKLTTLTRDEFEYEIPMTDAKDMLQGYCHGPIIEKNRYEIKVGNHLWELDEFFGENEGLIVAEIELSSEDEVFEKPAWLGREVSDEEKYYNASLAKLPFKQW